MQRATTHLTGSASTLLKEAGERLSVVALSSMCARKDVHQTEITALLKNGATKTWVAKKYGTTRRNLSHWIKQHGMV